MLDTTCEVDTDLNELPLDHSPFSRTRNTTIRRTQNNGPRAYRFTFMDAERKLRPSYRIDALPTSRTTLDGTPRAIRSPTAECPEQAYRRLHNPWPTAVVPEPHPRAPY